jgi:Tfp pilus assembly protein PilX
MNSAPRRQHGATLLMALIFLVLLSLLAISAYNGTNTNLRVVGNMQAREQAMAAAQVALEQTVSSANFSTNPDQVAANPVNVDIDNDGDTDFAVRITPQPKCYRSQPIKTVDLNPALPSDLACMKSGVVTTGGLEMDTATGGAAADSLCANTEWNVRAEATDAATGATVAVNQGVAIRVLATDAANACK